MKENDFFMARKIAERVAVAGGRVYFVGGYVRDQVLRRENKDIDIEVHGVSVQKLESIIDSLGERTEMGASFGIFGLKHYDLDIAMPRMERSTGLGHKDFAVSVDPFIGPQKAAERRDFTMNALMQDVITGEVLDFFGGQTDLKKRIIRHVNDSTFVEDPLRVFRAAQFAARFDFSVAEETTSLSSTIDVTALAGERIMGELEKALLKAKKPSVFFEELRKMNQLFVWFPELEALIDVPQGMEFHPEGDVWQHTMQVVDEAAALRHLAKEPLWFMLSALCHDFGKAVVTVETEGKIHAYRHELEGVPIVKKFLSRITTETKLTEYVLNLVQQHMEPNMMVDNSAGVKSFMRMFDKSVCPEDLLLLSKADYLGRKVQDSDKEKLLAEYEKTEIRLHKMLGLFQQRMKEPYLMGRDLVEAGIKPGPIFKPGLEYAHKLRLAGRPKEEQLRQTLGFIRKMETDNAGIKED